MKEEEKKLYCVLKLLTKIGTKNPFTGAEMEQKLEGCAGYLPVFDDYQIAIEESCDGKYDVVQIKPKDQ